MKIAFCFMVRDNLTQPHIWKEFFRNANKNTHTPLVFSHAKYRDRVTDEIIKNSLIRKHIETEWGHSSLVMVMLFLAHEAIKSGADWIIYLSDSCVPIRTYENIYEFLENSNNLSWFQQQVKIDKKQLKKKYKTLKRPQFIKKYELKKASQWCILNKADATQLVKTAPKLLPNFIHFEVPDEYYFLTILFHLNKNYKFNNGLTTLVDWVRRTPNTKHPRTFEILDAADVKLLTSINSLFCRKVDKTSDISNYINNLWKKTTTPQNISTRDDVSTYLSL